MKKADMTEEEESLVALSGAKGTILDFGVLVDLADKDSEVSLQQTFDRLFYLEM